MMDEKRTLQDLAQEALNEARAEVTNSAEAVMLAVSLLRKKRPGLADSQAFEQIWSLLPR